MKVLRFIISVLMAVIMPINSFFATLFNVDGNPEYDEIISNEKVCRDMGEFNPRENDIFVDAKSVSGDGSENSPFNTVEQAKEKAKALRNNGLEDKITVWIKGGNYIIENTLVFDSTDAENVVYKAYPGEKVYFSGAVSISEWQEATVNGISVFSADIPEGMRFDNVTKNGKILPKTRYPETGYLNIEKEDHTDADFTPETTPWEYTLGDKAFVGNSQFNPDKIENVENVCVRILHYWVNDLHYLTGYDSQLNKYYLANPAGMIIKTGDRYYFENILQELNSPGEWYFDINKNKLYYVPCEGERVDNTVVNVCINDKLIEISDNDGVEFFGITFCDTNFSYPEIIANDNAWISNFGIRMPQAEYDVEGAIEVSYSNNICFINCDFINIGNTALKFNYLVKNATVKSCLFKNIGANGVFINGYNDSEKATENIYVIDNKIESYGINWQSAIGVLLTHARNCAIQNNEISDGYYTAVSVGWVWGYSYSVTENIKIQDNLIYNIGQGWLSDMGGIYTLGIQNGTVISGNVIHNVAADASEGGYGGWGLYLDEGSSNIVAENNLIYSCGSHSFHLHYGKNNLIKNNIFALSEEGQLNVTRKEDHTQFYLENNIILSNDTLVYANFGDDNFIDNSNIYWDLKNRRFVVSSKNNNKDLWNLMYRADVKAQGFYNNAVFENPQFKDPENGDFRIAENNQAIKKANFIPWDYTKAGTISDFS